jgi:hypothetical protein
MIASRVLRCLSCRIPLTLLAFALVVFSANRSFAQAQDQVPHPLPPPALPPDDVTSRPVPPGQIPAASLQGVGPTNSLNTASWTALGPAALQTGGGLVSGRVAGIAVDPTNANNIYVAAAGGGIWQTTSGGSNWVPLTDTQPTLAMGAIAIAPTNHLRIYAGTGEANNSADSNHGQGILVSSDGGATWTLQTAGGAFAGTAVSQIAVDPTNADIAYVSIGGYRQNGTYTGNNGVWKTTDGGGTWTKLTGSVDTNSSSASWTAVVVDPNTPSIIYAAIGDLYDSYADNGIYRSTNSGATWALLSNGPTGTSAGRIALAVSAAANTSGHHVLYAAVSSTGTFGLYYFGRSDNADAATPTFTNLTSGTPNFLGGQGWYDIVVNVDSTGNVYCAGVVNYNTGQQHVIRSVNLGVNWSDITSVGGVSPHTDSHAIAFDSSNRMLLGSDGGVFRYDPTVPSWTVLNSNLNTIQFTGIGLHPTVATSVVGGSQDNGTEVYNNNLVWTETDGGDGGFSQYSATTPSRCYSIHPVASFGPVAFFQRSDDGCGTWSSETSGISYGNANFYPPFVVDPANGDHLLLGTISENESTNGASSWSVTGAPNTNGFNPSSSDIDSVALSPANGSNPQVIYVIAGGAFSSTSQIFVSLNDGLLWTAHNLPSCTVNGSISAGCRVNQIVIDSGDATGQTAVAVIGMFSASAGGHVFRTTNGGSVWTDISGNLPNLPTWSAQVDTDPNRTLYVSTDAGVYASVYPYSSWSAYGSGLPNAQGVDLELNRNLHLLGLATHGRGAWEIETPPHVTGVSTTAVNGTYGPGAIIPVVVTFSAAVNVTGTPHLGLNTNPAATAVYASGSGTTSLTFNYTVQTGQTTSGNPTGGHLDYASTSALSPNGGTITDTSNTATALTLYAPGASGSLSAGNSIVVASSGITTPGVTVSPSSSSVTVSQPLSVTVTVSGTPTPTGSITLTSGTYNSGARTLTGGSTLVSVPAGSLAVGSDTLTAAYTPDGGSSSTYTGAAGTAPVTVTQGIGTCTSANPNPNPNPASFADPGDFNGDCKSDILWRNSTSQLVYTWLMNGAAIGSQGGSSSPSSAWVIQGTGDFNGDGMSDILWRNSSTGEVYLWLMNGTSIASQSSLGVVASAWVIQGVGDFNGDGKADILWRNSSTGQVYLWTMNGAAISSQGAASAATSDWVIQGVGDFNGDGKADILWRNSTSGQVYLWLMNGTAITSQGSPATVSSDWVIQGVGDFNADGRSDILWRNSTSGLVYVWLMNGAAISSQASVNAATPDWVIKGVGDFNGDGKGDILWRNSTSGQVYVWLMNGTAISSQGSPATVTLDWQIAPTLYP